MPDLLHYFLLEKLENLMHYLLLEKCENLLHCKKNSHIFPMQ